MQLFACLSFYIPDSIQFKTFCILSIFIFAIPKKDEMKVLKFGGTSVGKPERMQQVSELITKEKVDKIVVLSALSGTTNALVSISECLAKSAREEAKRKIDELEAHY